MNACAMDGKSFQEYLDNALNSFRKQVLEAHHTSRSSLTRTSLTSSRFSRKESPSPPSKKKPNALTFLGDLSPSSNDEGNEEKIVHPPLSIRPAFMMAGEPEKSGADDNGSPASDPSPPKTPRQVSCSDAAESIQPPEPNHLQPARTPDSSKADSYISCGSNQSMVRAIEERTGEAKAADIDRTITAQTLDSQVDHTAETLRMRLGVRSGMITGKDLHDAAVALGLTRFSLQDVNTLVNKLADFVDLELEHRDTKARVARVARTSNTATTRRSGMGSTREHGTNIGGDLKSLKPQWKWPDDANEVGFWRSRTPAENPARQWNVVPFRALVLAFVLDADARKIFGSSAEHFWAMKEILLASDTNRLVAELTFVRINDLAAPQTARDPFLFLEPFVAIMITINAVLLGVQTDEALQEWPGWPWIELGFTAFMFCEAFIRLWILGQQEYFCGIESNWNYFDLFLLVTSIVDVCMTLITDASAESPTQLLRAFRLARLTRMFKVFRLKFIKELQLMVKGLLGGLRTLVCAFALLFVVLYIIAVFATFTIGRAPDLDGNLQILFRSVPSTMFTAFRCYSGECITEEGFPVALLLSENDQFGMIFVLLYVAGYMLVTMGIYNVILAVYVDITMKAARENEARTSEQHERESIRVARLTRELVKKFKMADEARRRDMDNDEEEDATMSQTLSAREKSSMTGDDEEGHPDEIQISKELFLLVIQDRQVQRLMDDLDLPKDRANLFEALDADSSGTLHLAELAQGLLKVRGELKKTDTVATLLATKAVYATLEQISEQIYDLRAGVAQATGDSSLASSRPPPKSIFDKR
ncbi:Sodium channel protein type 8 subunit alpha (Sodium channel protein type VIII subunit alpha) (Voltage-gated sodium channel subunit alpha Nav1.6) [Durusdinium trenchii]|uniref:Sodium channel protein type 8 subunit alpha (Sodium channel protein type VIII subunit alpha) (Voltage-gated sodium channel subunit alpha Nav1.6) n=1 Tax=Durusdinium trenchii TaxID=1381693 RepID=A0ABP0M457_9DINO